MITRIPGIPAKASLSQAIFSPARFRILYKYTEHTQQPPQQL